MGNKSGQGRRQNSTVATQGDAFFGTSHSETFFGDHRQEQKSEFDDFEGVRPTRIDTAQSSQFDFNPQSTPDDSFFPVSQMKKLEHNFGGMEVSKWDQSPAPVTPNQDTFVKPTQSGFERKPTIVNSAFDYPQQVQQVSTFDQFSNFAPIQSNPPPPPANPKPTPTTTTVPMLYEESELI